jgi:hypothetical protein
MILLEDFNNKNCKLLANTIFKNSFVKCKYSSHSSNYSFNAKSTSRFVFNLFIYIILILVFCISDNKNDNILFQLIKSPKQFGSVSCLEKSNYIIF